MSEHVEVDEMNTSEPAVEPGLAASQALEPVSSDAGSGPLFEVSIGTLAWVVGGLVFVLLRLGPLLQAPVGGAELVHLSGAWQARIGVDDDRYVPTLFQAATSLLLRADASETPARVLAFLLTATIPLALWRLRPAVGEAGAFVALVVLALDGPAILLGSTGSAMGADAAVTAWLAVFLLRGRPAWWFPAVMAFIVATSGPLALPLLAGWAARALMQKDPINWRMLGAAGSGALAGLAVATSRFGLGVDSVVVPPLDLFAAGYEQDWATATVWDLSLLYGLPLLTGGAAAIAWRLYEWRAGEPIERPMLVVLLWTAFAAGWWITAIGTDQTVPLVALSLPLALMIGAPATRMAVAMWRADWRWARYLIPAAFAATGLALAYIVDWVRVERVGGTEDKLLVGLWLLVTCAALVLAGYYREARGSLAAPAFILAGGMMVLTATGIVTSGREEPLPSPISPDQARELRDLALEATADSGGVIVIHPDFEEAMTWPFRDSGDVVVASRVPLDAGFVIWPAAEPAPEGFAIVQGQWSLRRAITPPTSGVLEFLHWLTDRNTLEIVPEPVAVYSRPSQ